MASVAGPTAGLRRSGIREMMELASTLEDVLHLEIGEPDFPTPPHIVEAVQRALAAGSVKYTLSRGTPALRELLVAKLRDRNRLEATVDDVVVTSGGTTAVYAALSCLVGPGDGVLVPSPGWWTPAMVAELLGARTLPYRLLPELGHAPDLDHVESLAAGARVLVVNSPSNPTGAVLDRAVLEGLLAIAQRHDLVVLSDEVYEHIVFDATPTSLASLGDPGRVVTVFSFSKGYAMTGWRVGYAVAPPAVADAMVKVLEAMVACPSWPGQKAAEAALAGPQEAVAAMRDAYRARRDAAVAALRERQLLVAEPRGAFYVLADVSRLPGDTYEVARRLLLERRVATAPGEAFGPNGAGTVRLSLASPPEVVTEAIRRIGEIV